MRDLQIGSGTPVLREMSVCRGPDGELQALDVSVFYESADLRLSLAGRTPLGSALINVR